MSNSDHTGLKSRGNFWSLKPGAGGPFTYAPPHEAASLNDSSVIYKGKRLIENNNNNKTQFYRCNQDKHKDSGCSGSLTLWGEKITFHALLYFQGERKGELTHSSVLFFFFSFSRTLMNVSWLSQSKIDDVRRQSRPVCRADATRRYRGSSRHGAACAAAGLSGQKTVTVDAPGLLHVDACAVIEQLIIPHPTYYRCLWLPRAVRRCSCALCSQHPACTSCTAVLHRPSASLSLSVFPAHTLSFSLSITHTP